MRAEAQPAPTRLIVEDQRIACGARRNNTGGSVTGGLVQRASGTGFAQQLHERLFPAAGMKDTAFFTTETERLASCYQPRPDGAVLWDPPDGCAAGRPRTGRRSCRRALRRRCARTS